jgi:predicted DNA-binding protein (UPF0251 family)
LSPRCKKPRYCECRLKGRAFKPTGIPMTDIEKITLYEDELETLKLCDFDGLTQEEAGNKMGVSRGTIQRLLSSARKKAAMALSECKAIVFEKTISKGETG